MGLVMLLICGLLMIAGPIAASVLGHGLGAVSTTILTVIGAALFLGSTIALVITKLYVKTKASEAFVRTGMGGPKVIMDGGSLVIPVVHQMVMITLQTLRLDVAREGADALITQDNLRADIKAEFFVRVQADADSIKNAARSFGDKMNDTTAVTKLVEDKLVSALRTVAATKTLASLNTERNGFLKAVIEIVTNDLAHNGLTLETVTISKLDQTPASNLDGNNIFNAQGLRTIAEIVQAQKTATNALVRAGDQARKQQDVETQMKILAFEQQQAAATANQAAAIAQAQAEQARLTQVAQIEAQRAGELAGVEKGKAIEVAKRDQQKAVEVADRARQQAVAMAEKDRAAAEAELATAEAEREKARQSIKTVEIQATAEREKAQQIIIAQASAETAFVAAQRKADAEAYRVKCEADARQAAAQAEAEAITRKATADANAKKALAEGEKAQALVPVQVSQAQVDVDRSRVETVLKPELEARQNFGGAAQQFELAKLQITKEAEVRIEAARATVNFTGKMTAQLFGTPEDAARMVQRMMSGMGIANTINGFTGAANEETLQAASGIVEKVTDVIGAAAKRLGAVPNGHSAANGDGNGAETAK